MIPVYRPKENLWFTWKIWFSSQNLFPWSRILIHLALYCLFHETKFRMNTVLKFICYRLKKIVNVFILGLHIIQSKCRQWLYSYISLSYRRQTRRFPVICSSWALKVAFTTVHYFLYFSFGSGLVWVDLYLRHLI